VTAGWLTGQRVVDLSTTIAGAYATKLLADAGAAVVIVEPPEGHPLRRWSASGTPTGDAGPLFRFLSAGKASVVADGEALADLLSGGQLLVESGQRPLDLDTVRAKGTTVCSVTPYGRTGPWAGRPATDFIIQAESGSIAFRGRRDQPPVAAGGRLAEWVTGAYAAVAALAAAPGEHVDVSELETMTLAGSLFLDLMWSLIGIEATGPARSLEVPSVEPTLDGWVGFNTNTRQQFDDFLVLIERPDLLGDPDWVSVAARAARLDEWNAIVHPWTSRHTTTDIVERAAALRIPVAPVMSGRGVVDIDHFVARGVFVEDATGTFRQPRSPYALDGVRADTTRPAPDLGATPPPSWNVDLAVGNEFQVPEPSLTALPLAGVRVIDATAWWAGPEAGRLLALLGADVLHLEATRQPDGMRMAGGLFVDQPRWWERSAIALSANTGKRGITLDLTTDDGRDLLDRLLADADVLLENFSPRVAERFALTPERLHALNPRLVLCRMPAFGLDGPWRDRVGFAQTMEQVTGMAWITGHVDDQPRIPRGPCDPLAGAHAAFAVLTALRARERTATGAFIESTMVEAALNIAAEQVIEWTANGVELQRRGNRAPGFSPQGLYPCAGEEQWLAVSVATDEQWAALVAVTGLTADRDDEDEVDAELAAWAADRDLQATVDDLIAAGIPAGAARDPRTIATHPQLEARGFFEELDHPVCGRQNVAGLPFRFESVDRWLHRPAPTMGEHDHEVLGGELGLSDDELARLTSAGVIGTAPSGL
jgi:crotonobetainyl-CoA:carnitine CoA-transferase CaiB-like acyl-CoA transferase